jgi:uncharacterized protein
MFMISKDLLDIMACPKCKGDLEEKGMFLLCNKCSLAYPILQERVPDMLIDDAWTVEKAKSAGFHHKESLDK